MKVRIKNTFIFTLGVSLLLPALVVGELQAQKSWTWYIDSAKVDSADQDFFDLTVGIKADTEEDEGSIGNFNIRGMTTHYLDEFNGTETPYILQICLDGFEMTLTNGPTFNDWQLNAVFDGLPENGPVVTTSGLIVATLRFHINDPDGFSGIDFIMLPQTYESDNISITSVSFDTTGGNVALRYVMTDVFEQHPVSLQFELYQNYPNPFNPETCIAYRLPVSCDVHIRIFSLMGEQIKSFHYRHQTAGFHHITWDGTDSQGNQMASGIYFLELKADGYSVTRKMTIIR